MAHTTTAGAVAEVVKNEMASAEISVRSMAAKAPMPYVTLTRRLSGQSPFTMSELIAIATVLNTKASLIMQAAEANGRAA